MWRFVQNRTRQSFLNPISLGLENEEATEFWHIESCLYQNNFLLLSVIQNKNRPRICSPRLELLKSGVLFHVGHQLPELPQFSREDSFLSHTHTYTHIYIMPPRGARDVSYFRISILYALCVVLFLMLFLCKRMRTIYCFCCCYCCYCFATAAVFGVDDNDNDDDQVDLR